MSLWVERHGGVKGSGGAHLVLVELGVETVVQLSEVDCPNIARSGRNKGLEIANNHAQGEGGQQTLLLSAEKSDETDSPRLFVLRETATRNTNGVVDETAKLLHWGGGLGFGGVADKTKADGGGHDVVKGTVAFGLGGTMDENVVHMDSDEDGGLAILTDEYSTDAKFGIISFAVPSACLLYTSDAADE